MYLRTGKAQNELKEAFGKYKVTIEFCFLVNEGKK